jgi:hypothetical protein
VVDPHGLKATDHGLGVGERHPGEEQRVARLERLHADERKEADHGKYRHHERQDALGTHRPQLTGEPARDRRRRRHPPLVVDGCCLKVVGHRGTQSRSGSIARTAGH